MRHRLAFLLTILLAANCWAQSGGLLNATRGIPQPNDGTTGTILRSTALINSAGNAVLATAASITATPGSPVRIVVGGAGTTGNAVLASAGTLASCTMDATVASGGGDYVLASTTADGQCHPQSTTPTAGTWVIGFLHDPATTSGSAALVHVNGFLYSSSGGGAALSALTAATTAHTIGNLNFPQRWNWAQTTDSQTGMTLGEDVTTPVPSTGGTVGTGGIANQKAVSIETAAGSTAVPLNITQNSMTGATATTNPPALQVQTTWNNGAAGPQNRAFVVNVTSTASSLASLMADFQLGASSVFQVTKSGDIGLASNRYMGPISNTNNMTICGGGVAGTITAVGSICATSTGSAAGGVIIRGGDNSSTGAAAVGGIALLRGGLLNQSSGFPAGVEGTAQVVEGYAASATGITAGMVVCMTTAAYQIAACPTNAQNVVGIAGTPVIASAGGAVPVVSYGTMVVALDNTATIGDVVCMSTTAAGQGHDNALTACTSPNLTLGVVIATAGTFLSASGQSTGSSTLSTSLPAVQLRIGH